MNEINRVRRLVGGNPGWSVALCTIFILVIGGSLLGAVRYDRTMPAVPITSVPCTIRTPGIYCMARDFYYGQSSGSAITIEADNVAIDFAGHKLWSDGAPTTKSIGMAANQRSRILIRNGTVACFQFGIQLSGTGQHGNQVLRMTCVGNTYIGLWAEGRATVVADNRIGNTGGCSLEGFTTPIGVHVAGPDSRIVENSVQDMTWRRGVTREVVALALDNAANTTVANNTFAQPNRSENSWGIWVNSVSDDFSRSVDVENNRFANYQFGSALIYARGRFSHNQYENVEFPRQLSTTDSTFGNSP